MRAGGMSGMSAGRGGTRRGGAASGMRGSVLGRRVAIGGLLLAALVVPVVLTWRSPRNSDNATVPLAALDLLRGNWRLHDWLLTPDNYVPTDIAAAAGVIAVFGAAPAVLQWFQGLVWSGCCLAAIGLACRDLLRGRARVVGAAACVTLLVLAVHPDRAAVDEFGQLGGHGSTVLIGLAMAWLATRVAEGARRPVSAVGSLAALGALAVAGSFADPMLVVFGCLPLALTASVRRLAGASGRHLWAIASVALLGGLAGQALLRLDAATGGFELLELPIGFARPGALPARLLLAGRSLLQCMGADALPEWGRRSLPLGPALPLVRSGFAVALIVAVLGVGREVWRGIAVARGAMPGFLDQALWTAFAVFLAAVVACGAFRGLDDARYVIPALVAGTVLTVRRCAGSPAFGALTAVAFAASLAFETGWIASGPGRGTYLWPWQKTLVGSLEAAGLAHGFAGYWDAMGITAETEGRVTILALGPWPDGHFAPLRWDGDLAWYHAARRDWTGRFFVVAADPPAKPWDLAQSNVLRALGPPARVIPSGGLLIDVYPARAALLDRLRLAGDGR